jgi:hypothetical protein
MKYGRHKKTDVVCFLFYEVRRIAKFRDKKKLKVTRGQGEGLMCCHLLMDIKFQFGMMKKFCR